MLRRAEGRDDGVRSEKIKKIFGECETETRSSRCQKSTLEKRIRRPSSLIHLQGQLLYTTRLQARFLAQWLIFVGFWLQPRGACAFCLEATWLRCRRQPSLPFCALLLFSAATFCRLLDCGLIVTCGVESPKTQADSFALFVDGIPYIDKSVTVDPELNSHW